MADWNSVGELLYGFRYAIALLALLYFFVVQYLSYRRLAHIKGPLLAGWSNLWLIGAVWRRNTHLEFYGVAKKYGSLARIGPNDIITTNVELLRRSSAVRSPYRRSDWYVGFRLAPGVDNLFSLRDDRLHAKRRSQMNKGYTGKENVGLEASIDKHVANLVSLIRRKYISTPSCTRPMDLSRKAQYFTIDMITDVAFGATFGDLEQDEDMHEYLQRTENSLPVMVMIGTVPSLKDWLQHPWIGRWIYPSATAEKGIGKLIGIAKKLVAERFTPDSQKRVEKEDMMQSFIRHGLTEQEAVSETLLQLMGGSDTSATAIRATMLYIMTHPHVYAKLQAEIDATPVSTSVISDSQARALPYLQAVIREGLRIFPPGTGLRSKTVPPEGDTIDGVFLPGGTNIGSNTWAVLRLKDIYGEDSDVFRPERWLEATPEKRKEMEQVGDLIFGYGKYRCLGERVAFLEFNKVFFELMKNFDWSIMDPTNPWRSENVGLWIQGGLNVRITDRLARG